MKCSEVVTTQDDETSVFWVAERIAREAPEFPLWFAVDDELLRACVAGAGFKAILTSTAHQSGTDRLAEANRTVGAEQVINVQADEPLVTGAQIRALASLLAGGAPMATLGTPFRTAADFLNPNQVKVVLAPAARRALYFSRSPMPYARDLQGRVDDAWVAAKPSAQVICSAFSSSNFPAAAATPEAIGYLGFHCGCPIVPRPGDAAFAILSDPAGLADLQRFSPGEPEFPDRSTTIVAQVPAIGRGHRLTFRGPGVDGFH